MSQNKAKNPTEDLMQQLMKDLNLAEEDLANGESSAEEDSSRVLTLGNTEELELGGDLSHLLNATFSADYKSVEGNAETQVAELNESFVDGLHLELPSAFAEMPATPVTPVLNVIAQNGGPLSSAKNAKNNNSSEQPDTVLEIAPGIQESNVSDVPAAHSSEVNSNEKTVALVSESSESASQMPFSDNEKTLAIAGYVNRAGQSEDNNVRVSVGQSRGAFSQGYASWGSSDSQLAQAENLKIAQEKILELEKENEKLRMQNEELIAASEIVKERADLLTGQIYEYKNDKDGLEQSFKNELNLVKSQHNRKDAELQKAQQKIDELDSRLKFDMRKIRIRERELENRLELIRAEKNALVKSKDESILDLRRKLDQLQMEVESYRQKCVELNKVIETNQDSFKRTTRALRLAMANLELQEESKAPLKKVD